MIEIKYLNQSYHQQIILEDINLSIVKGQTIGLVGHSGSGKSTLLRCLHGLEKPSSGTISLQGTSGLIFQHFNLFKHLSVLDNLCYAPIKVLKQCQESVKSKARSLLTRMGLIDKQNAFTHELSGGQKQRVAILRALMMNPQILLLDEPTSALDLILQNEIIMLIQELKSLGLTLVIASHDLTILKQVCDSVVYLDKGKLLHHEDVFSFFNHHSSLSKTQFLKAYQQKQELL